MSEEQKTEDNQQQAAKGITYVDLIGLIQSMEFQGAVENQSEESTNRLIVASLKQEAMQNIGIVQPLEEGESEENDSQPEQ